MVLNRRIVPVFVLALSGCIDEKGPEDYPDYGYKDGYAAGYNTTCEIRVSLIAADWDNPTYAANYRAGYAQGAQDCHAGVKY